MIRHIKKIIQNYLFELSVIVFFYFKDLIGFKVEKVLVKLLSGSKLVTLIGRVVVPGHGDLDILLVILYKRVKVPSVRSILYSTT